MTAATASRNTPTRNGDLIPLIVATGGQVFQGCMGAVNSTGKGVAAITATNITVVGVVDRDAGPNEQFNARRVVAPFNNSTSTDEITNADIGKDCYCVDDNTVAKTNGTNTRVRAGKVFLVDEYGVWVDFR